MFPGGAPLTPWLIFPSTVAGTVSAHLLLQQYGDMVATSIYLPLVLAVVLVATLERLMPYRAEWSPTGTDVRIDLIYMSVVQMALPKLLGVTIGLSVLQGLHAFELNFAVWPTELSTPTQFLMFVLGVSFIRYWIHRASHECAYLWRLHAVHHSPRKLYWLNLGRSHPAEQVLQFTAESLPFMVLGAPENLVHLYFVLVAVNGFLFHSNIRLQHGILNYVFATAELHRWHHSHDLEESSCNYGNLLIIWDILFGTYFLPTQREVGKLGLINRHYPTSFGSQLLAPLLAGIDKQPITLQRLPKWLRSGQLCSQVSKERTISS